MTSTSWAVCREVRRRTGWSQRRLAAAAGTTPATIARIEKGRMEPTVALLERIVRAAGFHLSMAIAEVDPDEAKARAASRHLSVEQRLRQNDRLTAMRSRPRPS